VKQTAPWLAALSLLLASCGTTTGDPPPGPGITIYDAVPVGSMVITEIQAHPNSARLQFLEFQVVGSESINLKGCQLVDSGTQEHRLSVTGDLDVEPGDWFLASDGAELGGWGKAEGEEPLPVLLLWDDMLLSHTDPTEEISLNCPDGTGARHVIDRVAFDWDSLAIRRGHSWQLEGPIDAESNDDPDNWCAAPSEGEAIYGMDDGVPDYGSPLGETLCRDLDGQATSEEGQLVINEILIDEFSGLREWFEIYNPGVADRELSGCTLGDASAAEPENSQTHLIDPDHGETVVAAGGFLLLSKSGLDLTSEATVIAQYSYSSLTFNNSEDQLLWIDCPGPSDGEPVRIDSITYNWSLFGSSLEGRSLLLDPGLADATSNDLSASWCLASAGAPYWSTGSGDDLREAWGTPGAPNDPCPVPEPTPVAGEFVFTEILARSAGSSIGHNEEWVELRNVSEQSLSLEGCLLTNDDAGGSSEHVIEPVFGLSVAAWDYVVLVRSSAADSIACELPQAYAYGNNISFNNTGSETLSLVCGTLENPVLVDSVTFDGGTEAFVAGMPRQLHGDAEDAALNDDPSNWCVSALPEEFLWSCSVGDDTNYGTPGSTSNCP
jgi:hypothetical protein